MSYQCAKLVRTGVSGVRPEVLKDDRARSMGGVLQNIVRSYRESLEKQKDEGWISHKARIESAQKLARDAAKRVQAVRENLSIYAENVRQRTASIDNLRRQLEGGLTQLDWHAAQAEAQHIAAMGVEARGKYLRTAVETGNVVAAVSYAMVPGCRNVAIDALQRMADPKGYAQLQDMRAALANLEQAANGALIGFDLMAKDADPVKVATDFGLALSALSANVGEVVLPQQAPPEPPPADVPPQEAA